MVAVLKRGVGLRVDNPFNVIVVGTGGRAPPPVNVVVVEEKPGCMPVA